jgi:probable F420-dependent oxidoreductase
MDIGVALPLPQNALGDPEHLRAFVRGVEEIGYAELVAFDHVLGADPAGRSPAPVRYTHESLFHEPLTFLAWAAGVTTTLGLATGVLISPQRQTVLIAKQAAEVDVLSAGRLRRLGLGVGANPVEYRGLGMPFGSRGRTLEGQVEILRALWSEPTVVVETGDIAILDAGLNPRPVRPLPIWLGGASEPAIDRAVRLGDGYVLLTSEPDAVQTIRIVRQRVDAAGRDGDAFGFQAWVLVGDTADDEHRATADRLREAGASQLTVLLDPAAPPPAGVAAHLDLLAGTLIRLAA